MYLKHRQRPEEKTLVDSSFRGSPTIGSLFLYLNSSIEHCQTAPSRKPSARSTLPPLGIPMLDSTSDRRRVNSNDFIRAYCAPADLGGSS